MSTFQLCDATRVRIVFRYGQYTSRECARQVRDLTIVYASGWELAMACNRQPGRTQPLARKFSVQGPGEQDPWRSVCAASVTWGKENGTRPRQIPFR